MRAAFGKVTLLRKGAVARIKAGQRLCVFKAGEDRDVPVGASHKPTSIYRDTVEIFVWMRIES